ncbi:MAG: hypoxanthine phosphoribosyltransferase [Candidatus Marinimicrobia bacterium]|jgi:hypoxanthine phosphoribosyltransferase|nr:hypoxanthine phosphoribosyltransferase [Candidatus Neomarinimicrobiota bacterium]MDP6499630.1 hypoxanthine phosphoribosyltransferase [Candidatus Neomarinimicrobiota bacterium]MDP6725775.1 hypoxanthine phosphoribosyltransferase [Candidatus Neomarinimicrobiota bacterium]|tara:strand:+ start:1459 stop:1989 length:531 start_codon:yes stop_codon:yes gene_type:complete
MHFHGYELSLVISNEEIQKRVAEIAKNLSEKFKDEVPILIGILNGSFIFMSDLIRALKIDCEMDFIKLSSYTGDQSIGTIRLLKDISADITGRHVVIVEDIIDSGLTIKFIKDRMKEAGPESLTIITLLLKPDVANLDFPIDIVGFEIAPEFVVGYGLDYDQKMRHLSAIYRIEKE